MAPDIRNIVLRDQALQAIRGFFHDQDYIEVETPLRIPAPALETHIDAPRSESAWLRTSPELHMKRMLAGGYERIFQIGSCFRRNECGSRHNPEFTMLEWYRVDADYNDILKETKNLLIHIFKTVTGAGEFHYQNRWISLEQSWNIMTVAEAFKRFAEWDPVATWDEERFENDLVKKVEPALPKNRPCVLTDYPAPAAALARLKPDNPVIAERWELYIGGLEIANTYSELCDPVQQRDRFERCAAERASLGREIYPRDDAFMLALENGIPPCAGSALGFDRLIMLLCNAPAIQDVRLFAQNPGELF
ncbi:MAG: EF-P lysine aminoacylase EpmA [Kiritimatiellia bacterium]